MFHSPLHTPLRGPYGTPAAERFGDRAVLWLGLVLAGYALMGRGFAYWGVPPLFVGEAMLGLGLLAALRSGSLGRTFREPVVLAFSLLFAWSLFRMAGSLGVYGLDAARDFMQVGYGLYAIVVAALVLRKPERLRQAILLFRRFVPVLLIGGLAAYLVFKLQKPPIPDIPWGHNVQWIEAKGGDLMVHLAGITAFILLGMERKKPWMLVALALDAAVIAVSNRGGMVAYAVAGAVFLLLRPKAARAGRLGYVLAALLGLGLLVGPLVEFESGTGAREISVEQIAENVLSVFGAGGDAALTSTTSWRLEWWENIYEYTVEGPLFWTGRGFGPNLGQTDLPPGVAALDVRNPHNGHLTMLARTGVPGLVLWLLVHALWYGTLLKAWAQARRAGAVRWQALFTFLLCYVTAAHVNGSFDIYFEGPMGGIWLWSLFGLGLAAARISYTHPGLLGAVPAASRPVYAAPGARPPGYVPPGSVPGPGTPRPAVPVGYRPPSAPAALLAPRPPGYVPPRQPAR